FCPSSMPLFHALRLAARFFAIAFRSDDWSMPVVRGIETVSGGDSPLWASFGKLSSRIAAMQHSQAIECKGAYDGFGTKEPLDSIPEGPLAGVLRTSQVGPGP